MGRRIVFILTFYFFCTSSYAATRLGTYKVPPIDIDLIGTLQNTYAHSNESLVDVAMRYRVGQNEIILANSSE